ncbi:hypothetical protein TGGT1_237290 [Toxoplasma gondii GT1]|uniref:Uncharacterized protein n=3 Tax=Toxoplasma gondii TaxID=5811 RepID=S7UR58_TOXGG|nr:hypothetical protein TGGT1_237290 [Toxoplasma gondii GT1]
MAQRLTASTGIASAPANQSSTLSPFSQDLPTQRPRDSTLQNGSSPPRKAGHTSFSSHSLPLSSFQSSSSLSASQSSSLLCLPQSSSSLISPQSASSLISPQSSSSLISPQSASSLSSPQSSSSLISPQSASSLSSPQSSSSLISPQSSSSLISPQSSSSLSSPQSSSCLSSVQSSSSLSSLQSSTCLSSVQSSSSLSSPQSSSSLSAPQSSSCLSFFQSSCSPSAPQSFSFLSSSSSVSQSASLTSLFSGTSVAAKSSASSRREPGPLLPTLPPRASCLRPGVSVSPLRSVSVSSLRGVSGSAMATPARWAGLVTGRGDKEEVKWELFVELDKTAKRLSILLDWKENKANGYRLSVLDDAKLESFSQWLDIFLAEQNVEGLTSSEVCLSNNRITHVGLDHLLTTLIRRKVGCRIMKLYRNNISDPGMVCLSRYISATREPLHELHLSHNKITARGAATLLRALAAHAGYPRVGRKGKLVPLWLRLEQNEITQVNKLMVFIHSKGVAFCTEKNRDLCGPSKCRHATSSWSPLVHLYVIDHQTHESGGSLLIPDVASHVASRQALLSLEEVEKGDKKDEKKAAKTEESDEKLEDKEDKETPAVAEPRKSCWLTRNESVLGTGRGREEKDGREDGEEGGAGPEGKSTAPGRDVDGSGEKKAVSGSSAIWGRQTGEKKEVEEKLPALDATDHASWPDIRSGSLRQGRGPRWGAVASADASEGCNGGEKEAPKTDASAADSSSSQNDEGVADERPRPCGSDAREHSREERGGCATPALSTTARSTAQEDREGTGLGVESRVAGGASPSSSLASSTHLQHSQGVSARGLPSPRGDEKAEAKSCASPASPRSLSSLGERRNSLVAATTASARSHGAKTRSRSGQRQELRASQEPAPAHDSDSRGAPREETGGDSSRRRDAEVCGVSGELKQTRRTPEGPESVESLGDRESGGGDRRFPERHRDAGPEPPGRDRVRGFSSDSAQSPGAFLQTRDGVSAATGDSKERGDAEQEKDPSETTCPFPSLASSYGFSSPSSRAPYAPRDVDSQIRSEECRDPRAGPVADRLRAETGQRPDPRFSCAAQFASRVEDPRGSVALRNMSSYASLKEESEQERVQRDRAERERIERERQVTFSSFARDRECAEARRNEENVEVNGLKQGGSKDEAGPYEERQKQENVGFSSYVAGSRHPQREPSPSLHARASLADARPVEPNSGFPYGAYPLEPPGLGTGSTGRRRSGTKGPLGAPEMEGPYGPSETRMSPRAEAYGNSTQFHPQASFPAYARRDSREEGARAWREGEREKKPTLSDVFAALPPEAQQAAADAFASELAARREAERSRGREGQTDPAKTEAEAARVAFLSVLAQASFSEDQPSKASSREPQKSPESRDLPEGRGYPGVSDSVAGSSRVFPTHAGREDRRGREDDMAFEKEIREAPVDSRQTRAHGLQAPSGGARAFEPWWGEGDFGDRRRTEKPDPFLPFVTRTREPGRENEELLPSLSSLLTTQTQGAAFYGLHGEGVRREEKGHTYAATTWANCAQVPEEPRGVDPRGGRCSYPGLFGKSEAKGPRDESLRLEFALTSSEGRAGASSRASGSVGSSQDWAQPSGSASSFSFSFFPGASGAVYAGAEQRRISDGQAPKREDLADFGSALGVAQRRHEAGQESFSPVIQPGASRGRPPFANPPYFAESDYVSSRLKATAQGDGDDQRLPRDASLGDSRLALQSTRGSTFSSLSGSANSAASLPPDAFAFAPLSGRKGAGVSASLCRGNSDSLANGRLDGEPSARADSAAAFSRTDGEDRVALSPFQLLQQNSLSRALFAPGGAASHEERARENEREELAFLRLLRGRQGEGAEPGDGEAFAAARASAEKARREGPFASLAFAADARAAGQEPRGRSSPRDAQPRAAEEAYVEARERPEEERRRFGLGPAAPARPAQLLWGAQAPDRDQEFPFRETSERETQFETRDFLRENWQKSEKGIFFPNNAFMNGVPRGVDRAGSDAAFKSGYGRQAFAFEGSAYSGLAGREHPDGRVGGVEREREPKDRDSGSASGAGPQPLPARKGDSFFFASLPGPAPAFHANEVARSMHYLPQQ